MNKLNGWQRIGVVLSLVWAVAIVSLKAYEYYGAYSYYLSSERQEATNAACRDAALKGPSPEKEAQKCIVSYAKAIGIPVTKPLLPSIPSILALIFLPIGGGWLITYTINWAMKWVRDGFKKH